MRVDLEKLRSDKGAAGRAWLSRLRVLQEQTQAMATGASDAEGAALTTAVTALVEKHRSGLRRLKAYEEDPRVRRLRREMGRLQNSSTLIQRKIADLRKLQTATGPSTTYDASGAQTGHRSGSPAAYEEAVERERLYHREATELDREMETLSRSLAKLAKEFDL